MEISGITQDLHELSLNEKTKEFKVEDEECFPLLVALGADAHSIPFDNWIPSRLCHSIILSFVGYKNRVCRILQLLNHKSRAFIIKADGLPGFLVAHSIKSLSAAGKQVTLDIEDAAIKGELEYGTHNKVVICKPHRTYSY